MAKPEESGGGERAQEWRPLVLVGFLAASLLVALVVHQSASSAASKVELLDDARATELLHILAARHREGGNVQVDGRVKRALIHLEESLGDELKNVRGVLKQLQSTQKTSLGQQTTPDDDQATKRDDTEARHKASEKEEAPHKDSTKDEVRHKDSENEEGRHKDSDQAWAKKTMQRGALRGESTEAQLKKVLERELEKEIQSKTAWKSQKDLKEAIEFAEYLKKNPLPEDRPTARDRNERAGEGEETKSEHIEDRGDADVVVKVEFKRGSMPESTFEAIRDELEKAAAAEEAEEKRRGEGGEGGEGGEEAARRGRERRGGEEAGGEEARRERKRLGVEELRGGSMKGEREEEKEREREGGEERRRERGSREARGGEERGGRERAREDEGRGGREGGKEGRRESKGSPSFTALPAKVVYDVQEGDKAVGEAMKKGRGWADREVLREHGEFVSLPSTQKEMLPLAVQPYWESALPGTKPPIMLRACSAMSGTSIG